MGQFRLRPPLFPCRVPPKHFCHPFICGKGTQFEALDKEQILKFDLEIHSIFFSLFLYLIHWDWLRGLKRKHANHAT